jgi:hypothetical protein
MSDPIIAFESLGYTLREAAFLYLVAVHSGYFLRRQFDYFIDRNRGGIAVRFIEKGRINGHIRLMDAGHGRQVYHLFYKPIYRVIGNPESQNRHRKGDADVRGRLMKLDYILENQQEHYLISAEEKLHFFGEARGIHPRFFMTAERKLQAELHSIPFSLADRTSPGSTLVRCAFIDEGLLTTRKFERVLSRITPLLVSLEYFEVVYVAHSGHNFEDAAKLFWKKFRPEGGAQQPPLAPDWRTARRNPVIENQRLRPNFTTLLLRFNYPLLPKDPAGCSVGCSPVSSTLTA